MAGDNADGADLLAAANFFVSSGLVHSGYTFVNSDEGWEQNKRDKATNRLIPGPKFGNSEAGMKAFVAKIHALGMKVGLYGAASAVTCGTMPGQLYNEDLDARTYADWGIDYLKSDNCASYALDPSVRFGAMRDALNRTGHPIVLSIEPFSIIPDPSQSVKVANLWRTGCDISGDWNDIINRADIADKWAPLARPGGWNDPDMINIQNPPGASKAAGHLSLGENRVYFGLWSIMKAPLILSSHLPDLIPDLVRIINNTEVISVNQDSAGVQARKLAVNAQPLPWLVGLEPCDYAPPRFYSRSFHSVASADTREWRVQNSSGHFRIFSVSTGRCLTVAGSTPVLLPCDDTKTEQQWQFGKGLHSPSSLYSVQTGQAIGVSPSTLFSAPHKYKGGNDLYRVPSKAYGETTIEMVARHDQTSCGRRGCENYDDTQMWWWDPSESLLRLSTYTASLNHAQNGGQGLSGGGTGYLTPKTPTYQHHCLAHVLSNSDTSTAFGDTEVWGGPLANGEYVMAAVNRGSTNASIWLNWSMMEITNMPSIFNVRDLWSHSVILQGQRGGFRAMVPSHDMAIYRLEQGRGGDGN